MGLDWQEELAEEDKRQEITEGIPNWDRLTWKERDILLEESLERWREEREGEMDEEEMVCPNCGIVINNWNSCQNCGYDIR